MSGFSLGDTSVRTTLKYGLNPAAKKKRAAKPLSGPIAAFADADDSDDGDEGAAGIKSRGNAEVLRQQAAARRDQKAAEMHAAALAEDPTLFEYDAHVDSNHAARRAKLDAADAERVERKSRYVETLIAKQKERAREEAIVYERRLLRERQKEDHLYADKEKFVTASYRAKLEADAKWLAEDRARDDAEAAEDVTKRGDMSDFHRNLMTRNASAGADAGIGAGGRKAPEPAAETPEQTAAREAKEAAEEEGRRLRAAVEAAKARESDTSAAAARERDDRDRRRVEGAPGSAAASRPTEGGLETRERPKDDPAAAAAKAKEAAAAKAAAAKQRYLERKRKAT